jgi:hypothetical protein
MDEKITSVVCAKNTANYSGYVAIVSETKVTVFLAQSEEMYVYYDKVYEFDFYKMRSLGLGALITHLDFS